MCNCTKKRRVKFVWTDPNDSTRTMDYSTEVAAKAKVTRKGGSYVAVTR